MEQSEAQETLQSFWQQWCLEHNGQLPSRRDMDTRENKRHFPYVVVFDILDDPLDFQYRLVGTRVRENTFADYTGKSLSQMDGKGPGSKIWSFLDTARTSKETSFAQVPYVGPKKEFMKSSLLFLPLASDNHTPDKIFLVSHFYYCTE